MKYSFVFWVLLCFVNTIDAQRIGLGDLPNSSHQTTSINLIESITDAEIVTATWSNIWIYDYFKTDSVVVTANPYINNNSWFGRLPQRNSYTLHVFSALNTQTQIGYYSKFNYHKNALTVHGDYTQPNHPKVDLIIPISDYTNSQANSWASAVGAAMIYNIIDTFQQVRGRLPYSFETKAILLNTRTESGFIDTLQAKASINNSLVDSLAYHQSNTHTIDINSVCDSVKVMLYYNDTSRIYNDYLTLIDTLTFGGNHILNIEQQVFYNVQNDLNITVNYTGGDSAFIRENWHYKNVDVKQVVLLNNDSVRVLSDSIESYNLMPISGDCNSYGNHEMEIELYNGNGQQWQTDSIVAIHYFHYETDSNDVNGDVIKIDDIYDVFNVGDTIELYRCDTYLHSLDTLTKNVKYALAWTYYENNSFMPVELTHFEISSPDPAAQTVFLNWQTASEQNNSRFEVQHSIDGIDFETIGIVSGNGTVAEVSDYHFVDNYPVDGINYYRLKQVDYNGDFEYSDIRSVEISKQDAIRLQGNYLQTNSNSFIYNAQGQLVTSFNHQFDISQLSSGIYFIRSIENENYSTFKFIKP